MSAPLTEALPYGVRDVKLTPYVDTAGRTLGTVSYDLPNMQTFSFSETEEFQELRGDDRIVATRGQGSQVDWSLESGGISLRAWAIFTGGEVIESGLAPNRSITMRKRGSDARGYFRVDGQSISDSGGDVRCIVYRCKVNDGIEGDFADGEFFVTNASGIGLPLADDANDLLYDLVQNEQRTSIPLTPIPNPLATPQNVTPGALTTTTAALSWTAVQGATSYVVEESASPYTTWTAVSGANGGTPTTNSASLAGRTSGQARKYRVRAVSAAGTSNPSVETGIVTQP